MMENQADHAVETEIGNGMETECIQGLYHQGTQKPEQLPIPCLRSL